MIPIEVRVQTGEQVLAKINIASTLPPFRLGITAALGAEWNTQLAYFGADRIQAARTYGKDNIYGSDADALTEWAKWGTERWTGLDPRVLMVLSCKDDTDEYLDDWALSFPPPLDLAALGFPGVVAMPWHEPWDEVRDGVFDWAAYRASGTAIANWRERHPRGKELIRWLGPNLTRYDIVDQNNDPANAGFEGMNIFTFDTYQSSTTGGYWTPQKMIDEPVSRIHAKFPGIQIGIPEYGYARQTSDSSGAGWATAHRNLVSYMRSLEYMRFGIAFNSVGSIPAVPFYTNPPVAPLYRDELLVPFG